MGEATLVARVGPGHECYIVSLPSQTPVVGGTRSEVEAFWKAHCLGGWCEHSALVLADGTVLDDNEAGRS